MRALSVLLVIAVMGSGCVDPTQAPTEPDGPGQSNGDDGLEGEANLTYEITILDETMDNRTVRANVTVHNTGNAPGYLGPINRSLHVLAPWDLTNRTWVNAVGPEDSCGGASRVRYADGDMLQIRPNSSAELTFHDCEEWDLQRGHQYNITLWYFFRATDRGDITVPLEEQFYVEVIWQAPP